MPLVERGMVLLTEELTGQLLQAEMAEYLGAALASPLSRRQLCGAFSEGQVLDKQAPSN